MGNVGWRAGVLFSALLLLASCRSHYVVTGVSSRRVAVDASLDDKQSAEVLQLIQPYRAGIDSMMNYVLGEVTTDLDRGRPESLAGNLVAGVLRNAAAEVLGKPADMGLANAGGLRSDIAKGNITMANAYELLPFENSLCVLTLKGSDLMELFRNIAVRGGEPVSGARMVIDREGNVLECSIQGQPVDESKLYTVATVDYLAEGNDGLHALTKAVKRECPDGRTLRGLFIEFVQSQTAQGKPIAVEKDGRITVKK